MAKSSRPKSSGSKTARQRKKPADYSFAFQGFRNGWYVLTADMTIEGDSLDAHAFDGRVVDWLVSQRVTPGKWSHFGSGNTGEYPVVPNEDGSELCLLLKRPADVLRLSAAFSCTGLTDETILAALQAESREHRFVLEDAAEIIHAALRKLLATFSADLPRWKELDGETRVSFIVQVRRRLERPDETVESMHQTWFDQRQREGWKYGATFDRAERLDPDMVPWKYLSAVTQTRYRLIASMASAMAPLMID